jgi:hypothetical protein
VSAAQLLAEARDAGVMLVVRGKDRLGYSAPAGVLDRTGLRTRLLEHKAAVLSALNDPYTPMRLRLERIASSEGIDLSLIRNLPGDDVGACHGLTDETLTAYVRALRDSDLRRRGLVPADEIVIAVCRHCGPIWTHPQVAAVAPTVDGIPYVLGCPWCHVRDRSTIPHPSLPEIRP